MTKIFKAFLCLTIVIYFLSSCNVYQKKTFLDFEFGITYNEFYDHAKTLQKSNLISNLTEGRFDYYLDIGNNKLIKFICSFGVFRDTRFASITLNAQNTLTESEKTFLYNMLVNKYGKPSYPLQINPYYHCYKTAHWDLNSNDVNIAFENCESNSATIDYAATGKQYEDIKNKDKKDQGVIDVKNK